MVTNGSEIQIALGKFLKTFNILINYFVYCSHPDKANVSNNLYNTNKIGIKNNNFLLTILTPYQIFNYK